MAGNPALMTVLHKSFTNQAHYISNTTGINQGKSNKFCLKKQAQESLAAAISFTKHL